MFFVYVKFVSGVRTHQGFYGTRDVLFTLAGEEIPACYTPSKKKGFSPLIKT